MKKVLVILIVGVVLFGCFSAQNANAQSSNIAQKIIGTWTEQDGTTWVFNANGTLTLSRGGRTQDNKYAVTDTKLAVSEYVYEISLSADGKTLILVRVNDKDHHAWLTKK
jgi:hypothetical protein